MSMLLQQRHYNVLQRRRCKVNRTNTIFCLRGNWLSRNALGHHRRRCDTKHREDCYSNDSRHRRRRRRRRIDHSMVSPGGANVHPQRCHLIGLHGSLGPRESVTKQHLDRFSRFAVLGVVFSTKRHADRRSILGLHLYRNSPHLASTACGDAG